jgi:hypothetical protein
MVIRFFEVCEVTVGSVSRTELTCRWMRKVEPENVGLSKLDRKVTMDRLLEDSWKTLGRLLEDSWKTLGRLLEDSWGTLGGLLGDSWGTLRELLGNS